ncbi:MAG: hypothetical protein BGN97_09335 [Microbacterium sp. 69-10]|uniref:TOPRIM nucleotidyl transferase/hydrolase domain-containing protein n=1 Tax=Microbacterium sp. 69-10 TaxID=1895783 RepID=UPI0009656B04|nr:TOPRIM nucleotidyl transferase/hydrolase domain-containing protein [Microbacterium sp. 69-10]OJU42532.1 MAG: hypothetical protein BGN97_09335 [Microbacterium sp. 69-10]
MTAVVLVEGRSDRLALEALARRRAESQAGDDSLDGVELRELDGITNLRKALTALRGTSARVLGLYDAAERRYVQMVLARLGMLDDAAGPTPDMDPLEPLGFFGCERDLEDEVIRAAGAELVLEALDTRERARFRRFQRQPAQRVRIEEQLHRFAGTAAGRKSRFAADVIDAVPLDRTPATLNRLLDRVGGR